ncbi:retrovirus-related Pol polyprotein from transposon TNT 1-94 [Trichonephila clavata]|uniref:Retrovirus-related Pol polyprotein from transposon TNT 1-94 n=1 Tax=Trichonephila clavata TaxID=2740835 RepID=A0A8X6GPR8_TRICU|nr:retrovirus-related Pol polyprotein from transposon TNT 1-94 [Trichonephila clavata]
MKRFFLSMKNLSAIITDGAPTMVGKNGGLVKMVSSEPVAAGNTILMTEIESKAHIEKLVGAANWSKWKRQIELLLQHHDVHDVVCGDRERPSLPTEASAEAIAAYEKAQKAFVKDDPLAQLILVGNMDDSNAELTSVYNTAKSVWEKLL